MSPPAVSPPRRTRIRARSSGIACRLLPLLLLNCAAGDSPPAGSPAVSPATATSIRLVDQIGTADITSPVNGPSDLLAALAGATRGRPEDESSGQTLEAEAALGCSRHESGVLQCGRATGDFALRYRMAMASDSRSAVILEMRSEPAECASIEAWDATERTRPDVAAIRDGWSLVPLVWTTGPESTEVVLKMGRRRMAEPCHVDVRSVRRFDLGHAFESGLALLDQRSSLLRPEADSRGLARKGVFLPRADAERVKPPFVQNFSLREVLLAPPPTELRFPVTVPYGSRLLFSYGLSRESRLGDLVTFEVAVRQSGEESIVWQVEFELTRDNWHWHDVQVEFEPFWSAPVELVLRTRSDTSSAFALWGTPTLDLPRTQQDPPNVVLIAVDTLRADRLSAYGYPSPTSPRIDELAADGVLFERAISSSNWTIPSFASIFTGYIVPRHRLATFAQRLSTRTKTLAEHLRDGGWRTQGVLYHPALYERLHQGFEDHLTVPKKEHLAEENLQTALEWLDHSADQRFFLFLHFSDPHQPFTQPEPWLAPESKESLAHLDLGLPLYLRTRFPRCSPCMEGDRVADDAKALARQLYDEEIRYVDSQIGRLLDELRQRGLYDDTIVALVSDHGESLWDHDEYYGHGGTSQYAELIDVPLIVKPALQFGAGRGVRVAEQVQSYDLMPTLLHLVGLEPADDLDASSLLPFLSESPAVSPDTDRPAFSQSSASAAWTTGVWKYVMPVGLGIDVANPDKPSLPHELLFHLPSDPGEKRSVINKHPNVAREMRRRAVEYLVRRVGGRFLLLTGREIPENHGLAVSCRPGCRWDPLVQFGMERSPVSNPEADLFTGAGLGGDILLLARFEADPEVELRLAWRSAAGTESSLALEGSLSAGAGWLDETIRPEGVGAWLIDAPNRVPAIEDETSGAAPDLDPQQAEALRALGYIE